MLTQIALGTVLIVATVLVSAALYMVMEAGIRRHDGWLQRKPHLPKLAVVLVWAVLWALAITTVSVWIWAFAYLWLGLFDTLEAAMYFSMVAFTTLGFGDVLLPKGWRLLSGIAAANGLLNFGLLTAMLVEVLRNLRRGQDRTDRGRTGHVGGGGPG